MSDTQVQTPSFNLRMEASLSMLEAMKNNTGFALLALSCHNLESQDDFYQVPSDYLNGCETPMHHLQNMAEKYADNLAVADLYDNQDEFGATMPSELMLEVTPKQVKQMKIDMKELLALVFNINTQQDKEAFCQRIKQAKNTYSRVGNIDLDLVNSDFMVLDEDEAGNCVEVIEFRYRTRTKMYLNTAEWCSLNQTNDDINVTIQFVMYARDFNGECRTEITTTLGGLIDAINS